MRKSLKKYNENNFKIRIMTGVNLTPLVQIVHFFAGRQRVKGKTMKMKLTLQEICTCGSLQSHLNFSEKHLKFCLKDGNGLLITGGDCCE